MRPDSVPVDSPFGHPPVVGLAAGHRHPDSCCLVVHHHPVGPDSDHLVAADSLEHFASPAVVGRRSVPVVADHSPGRSVVGFPPVAVRDSRAPGFLLQQDPVDPFAQAAAGFLLVAVLQAGQTDFRPRPVRDLACLQQLAGLVPFALRVLLVGQMDLDRSRRPFAVGVDHRAAGSGPDYPGDVVR